MSAFVEGVAEESALDLVAASGCSIQAGLRGLMLYYRGLNKVFYYNYSVKSPKTLFESRNPKTLNFGLRGI